MAAKQADPSLLTGRILTLMIMNIIITG